MICPKCGYEFDDGTFVCPLCGTTYNKEEMTVLLRTIVSSKKDEKTSLMKEFNWGAFGLTFIWGIFNKSYITFIMIPFLFIPGTFGFLFNLGLQIWFGMNGNAWAWQNKDWHSVTEFEEYQKKWAMAYALIIFGILLIVPVIYFILPAIMHTK